MTKEDDVSIGDEFMSQPSTPRLVMCLNIQYLKENRIGMKTKIECRLKHSERLLRTFAEGYFEVSHMLN